jgi:tRNA threonylcarbamoyladenosine biosynthesis protein TsaE
MNTLTVTTASAAETQDLGKGIGQRLSPGSILALIGELGCGKTCFTQGLCSGLEVSQGYVNSPTFTFINEYSGRLPVFHFDLYRADDTDTILDIGVPDTLLRAAEGVAVIEWAEKIGPMLEQEERLEVRFSVLSPNEREIRFIAVGERFAGLLEEIAKV